MIFSAVKSFYSNHVFCCIYFKVLKPFCDWIILLVWEIKKLCVFQILEMKNFEMKVLFTLVTHRVILNWVLYIFKH